MNAQYRHVLLATDLQPDTLAVAHRARQLAEFYQARLSAVHGVEMIPLYMGDEMMMPDTPLIEEQLVQRAERKMVELADEIGISSTDAHVVIGSPKMAVLEFVAQHGVDLVVIGRHSRHGINRLLGSTANGIIHSASCDVLTVQLGDE